jgi:hypothetical protein
MSDRRYWGYTIYGFGIACHVEAVLQDHPTWAVILAGLFIASGAYLLSSERRRRR